MSREKAELRKKLIEQRKSKSEAMFIKKSQKITNILLHLTAFQQAQHILFYVSNNGEVHTHKLIKKLLSSNKSIYVPLSEPKTHTLMISILHHFEDLTKSTYGILEPKKEKQEIVPIDSIELIIVPGVGFDPLGHRIGQGGGYYDWLLSKTKATSIALAFEFQILDFIPTGPHDQLVDIIITENQVINCK